MLLAVNSTTSFGITREDTVHELQQKKALNKKAGRIAKTAYLAAAGTGLAVLNSTTKGMPYAWNTAIRKSLTGAAAKVNEWMPKALKAVVTPFYNLTIGQNPRVKNTTLRAGIEKVGSFAGNVITRSCNLAEKAMNAVAKSSGRQKLMVAGAAVALAGFVALAKHFSKNEGRVQQQIDNLTA